ncbi:hypothetical protein [Desulfobotulus alkaliphilus]|uniref:hypothetical protein n=1 Tax=Desulfobotulus alkaliphilus TaxID=622671 RepID=UPI00119EB749|nr:hypothetical protein [Desulfobotulus alkaliphilus]
MRILSSSTLKISVTVHQIDPSAIEDRKIAGANRTCLRKPVRVPLQRRADSFREDRRAFSSSGL